MTALGCGQRFQACRGEECSAEGSGGVSASRGSGGGDGGSSTRTSVSSGGTDGSGGFHEGEAGEAGAGISAGGMSGAGGNMDRCDAEAAPGGDACVIDEAFGFFVSPEGDDDEGDGTRSAPFESLQKAADVAADAPGARVYACANGGVYTRALILDEDHGGLEIYGSFDCGDWSYDAGLSASIAPESGTALSVSGLTGGLLLHGLTFESADALEPGASSIAARIEGSAGVALENVMLRARAGADGARGATNAVGFSAVTELHGQNGTALEEGTSEAIECSAHGSTQGGRGGTTAPSDGWTGQPDYEGAGGEGGLQAACGSGGTGANGAPGPPGLDGGGADSLGSLTSMGWTPTPGADGDPGQPGQGGGGGVGATTGGGGAGGAGGCGGAGGGAGGGGGASIALLLIGSEVSLIDAELTAGKAGSGGPGAAGQQGQEQVGIGGTGGPGACVGGNGGIGGDGGAGGGGAGGISVGILYQAEPATLIGTVITPGTAGSAGEGAGDANDGIAGLAAAELEIPAA